MWSIGLGKKVMVNMVSFIWGVYIIINLRYGLRDDKFD